jgi:hypothetical protein
MAKAAGTVKAMKGEGNSLEAIYRRLKNFEA